MSRRLVKWTTGRTSGSTSRNECQGGTSIKLQPRPWLKLLELDGEKHKRLLESVDTTLDMLAEVAHNQSTLPERIQSEAVKISISWICAWFEDDRMGPIPPIFVFIFSVAVNSTDKHSGWNLDQIKPIRKSRPARTSYNTKTSPPHSREWTHNKSTQTQIKVRSTRNEFRKNLRSRTSDIKWCGL
jgi:hypothetical protein